MVPVEDGHNFAVQAVIYLSHNYPALEGAVILPLILKHYRWVALGCAAVVAATSGFLLFETFGPTGQFYSRGLPILVVQLAVAFVGSAAIFALKSFLWRALGAAGKPSASAAGGG